MRLLAFLAVLVLVPACGGATETDLVGNPPPGADAGNVNDAGSVDPDVNVPPSNDASVADVGVSETGVADVNVPDVVLPPADPGIWCGVDKSQNDVFCASTTQLCCYQKFAMNPTYTCKAGGTVAPCPGGTPIFCDSQADCNGKICCGDLLNNGYEAVSCKTTCTGTVNYRTQIRFCDPDALQDECASIGQACAPSNALEGFYICK